MAANIYLYPCYSEPIGRNAWLQTCTRN